MNWRTDFVYLFETLCNLLQRFIIMVCEVTRGIFSFLTNMTNISSFLTITRRYYHCSFPVSVDLLHFYPMGNKIAEIYKTQIVYIISRTNIKVLNSNKFEYAFHTNIEMLRRICEGHFSTLYINLLLIS